MLWSKSSFEFNLSPDLCQDNEIMQLLSTPHQNVHITRFQPDVPGVFWRSTAAPKLDERDAKEQFVFLISCATFHRKNVGKHGQTHWQMWCSNIDWRRGMRCGLLFLSNNVQLIGIWIYDGCREYVFVELWWNIQGSSVIDFINGVWYPAIYGICWNHVCGRSSMYPTKPAPTSYVCSENMSHVWNAFQCVIKVLRVVCTTIHAFVSTKVLFYCTKKRSRYNSALKSAECSHSSNKPLTNIPNICQLLLCPRRKLYGSDNTYA